MKALFILNQAPYGAETTYNGLRLAAALAKREHNMVRIYLMGDAVAVARSGQKVREGQVSLERTLTDMMGRLTGPVAACSGCMDARGLQDGDLVPGCHRGTLDELADWSEWADKVFTF